ncbi:MAG: carboxypeptidase-like regulatory domain-containing protein [Candidatus Riflebacteria bacterium]
MNLRFLGGWFLVLAGIGIMLTMGCEKGALGVKPAVVTGQIVDKDNPTLGVANAVVKMMSKEQVGSSELKQGATFATAVTNAEGNFIFENVSADNVVFEIEASGYAKSQYPEVTSTATEEGETALTAVVDKVYIRSGSVTNLGRISMRKIANPLPETITASIVLRDSKTMEILDESAGPVTISFNNQAITLPVTNWKNGLDLTGNPIVLTAESEFKVMVRANPSFYLAKEETLSGAGNIQADILVTPVTYNIMLRCTNVPDYIDGGVVNVFAETIKGDKPPQVIATHSIDDLGALSAPNLPEIITVPGLALPVNLRIQVRGYQDEIMVISQDNLPAGTMGTYRLDVNFLESIQGPIIYHPTIASQAGLLDNRIKRNVILRVAGPHLIAGDSTDAFINLPYESKTYLNDIGAASWVSNNGGPVDVIFNNTVVGYNLSYTVSVTAGNPLSIASGSYVISSEDPMMVSPPQDSTNPSLLIGVAAERPE